MAPHGTSNHLPVPARLGCPDGVGMTIFPGDKWQHLCEARSRGTLTINNTQVSISKLILIQVPEIVSMSVDTCH